MKTRQISSATNETIKEAVRLKRKRNRYASRSFLAEGEDLLQAAATSGAIPRQVFVLQRHLDQVLALLARAGAPVEDWAVAEGAALPEGESAAEPPEIFSCTETVMAKLSDLGSGTRVAAVFDFLDRPLSYSGPEWQKVAGPVVYLSTLSDPGNVGTLIRSASALGAAAVILSPESADPYSPKALRATMGAVFQLPLYLDISPGQLTGWAAAAGLKVVCSDPRGAVPLWEAALAEPFVLVLGSERAGVPGQLKAAALAIVTIPQAPGAESINVAMAGTAILYEAMRQRSHA